MGHLLSCTRSDEGTLFWRLAEPPKNSYSDFKQKNSDGDSIEAYFNNIINSVVRRYGANTKFSCVSRFTNLTISNYRGKLEDIINDCQIWYGNQIASSFMILEGKSIGFYQRIGNEYQLIHIFKLVMAV